MLNKLFSDLQEGPQIAIEWAAMQGLMIEGDHDKIMLIMIDEDSTEAALDVISGLGGEVTDRYQTWIVAWVPNGSLDAIAE